MTDWKTIAPITHAETEGPGRRFVWGLAAFLVCIPITMICLRVFVAPIVDAKVAEKPGNTHTIVLNIDGMECAMCAVKVEEAIGAVKGVKSVKANFETGRTEIICNVLDTASISEAIARAVATTEYTIAGTKPDGAAPRPADADADHNHDPPAQPENAGTPPATTPGTP